MFARGLSSHHQIARLFLRGIHENVIIAAIQTIAVLLVLAIL